MLSNGGNGVSRMDCALSQSMDSVNTVAAEEEVTFVLSNNLLRFFILLYSTVYRLSSQNRWRKVSNIYKYSWTRDCCCSLSSSSPPFFSPSSSYYYSREPSLRSSEQRVATRPPTFLSCCCSFSPRRTPWQRKASQPGDSLLSSNGNQKKTPFICCYHYLVEGGREGIILPIV